MATVKPKTGTKAKKQKVVLRMPPTWSYSRWSTYELCPRKAKLAYIDMIRFEGGDRTAADRGTEIHTIAEELLLAKKLKLSDIPPILAFFAEDIMRLRKLRAVPEMALGLKRDWTGCDFDDPDYWWHGELDIVAMLSDTHAFIGDWKTGKIRESHAVQLELYALAVFLHDEHIEQITVEDWYIDQNKKSKPVTYLRRQVPMLIKLWERKVGPMFADTAFPPCPNFLCGWCDYSKKNGTGLCEY